MSWADAPAMELLARAKVVHFASSTSEGQLVLRALNAVLVDDLVAFHGSPAGEKAACIGRSAVVSAEETVASIASYFVDPERACPASTYYRSVQVEGVVREIVDPAVKARVLSAFMRKFQPEGGYVPIESHHPLYETMLAKMLVFGVPVAKVCGRIKLGQHRPPKDVLAIVDGLFRRGAPGDMEAIEAILAHVGTISRPPWLCGPEGVTLHLALGEDDVEAAVDLVGSEYWNVGVTRDEIASAHRRSSAWVGARDQAGRLVASARAVSDGSKFAWIADVAVAKQLRGRGVGSALLQLLLDHPAVRNVRNVSLRTADAHEFYRTFGFDEGSEMVRNFRSTWMVRPKPAAPTP